MIRWLVAAAGLALAACAAPKADALGMFGNQDNFDVIQPVVVPAELRPMMPEQWSNGADLVRHSQTTFVVAGVWVADKGYALKMHGSGKYIQLDDKKIALFQTMGLLPKQMPKAGISTTTYLVGYSLWFILGFFGIFFALSPKARERFVQNLSSQYGKTPAHAPLGASQGPEPMVAPAWQARAEAMMSGAAAAKPKAALGPARPIAKPTYRPMVEGGPRGFGRKR
jgi:hypothetical protein